MLLNTHVTTIKGVGEETAKLLARLKIKTIEELLFSVPRRYDDYSQIMSLATVRPGRISIKVNVESVKGRYVRRGLHITEAVLKDESGKLKAVWFNQPYRKEALSGKATYFMSGEYAYQNRQYVLSNPSVEKVSDFPKNAARIVPVYRETKGLKSHQIRKIIATVLESTSIRETLPKSIAHTIKLMPLEKALKEIHFPSSQALKEDAERRLAFEEVFELQLANQLNRQAIDEELSAAIAFDEKLAQSFVRSLPFSLTAAQKRAAWDVLQDMSKKRPMNRLVEGDVGSGKTVVAAFAALMAVRQGFQVAVMAPTEILARQHLESMRELLGKGVNIELLVSGVASAEKSKIKEQFEDGNTEVLVGTHALLQDDLGAQKLGLIVIDEQHRFGVKQRQALQQKAGVMPHVLSMTATPIPRTLALTLYGELDVSVIDELPPGRKPVKTKVFAPTARQQLYRAIDKHIEAGRQMFVICPLVSESDKLGVKSVESEYELLRQSVFKHRRIGLLHGKLRPDEKKATMQSFARGDLNVLVSTTVIEVGVNVPNASIILIEGAERFGLAQLHQLRGRVGRSSHQAYCFLIPSTHAQVSRRLRELEQNNDGFSLAEVDLELRGPGQIYGTMQHGALDLRVATLTDAKLIVLANKAAKRFLESGEDLLQYKRLHERVKKLRAVTNLN